MLVADCLSNDFSEALLERGLVDVPFVRIDGALHTVYRVYRRPGVGRWFPEDFESAEAAVAALEPVGRGASMGALGTVRPNGDLDLTLTIRTFAVVDGRIHLWVGGRNLALQRRLPEGVQPVLDIALVPGLLKAWRSQH